MQIHIGKDVQGRNLVLARNLISRFRYIRKKYSGCQASTIRCVATNNASPLIQQTDEAESQAKFTVYCPICQTKEFDFDTQPKRGTKVECDNCNRSFDCSKDYIDLTVTSGFQFKTYSERQWAGTELFRSPLVSFAYERGWRQNFVSFGAPGPDEEFSKAMQFFEDVKGGTLVDLSCGSGLFTRRFLQSNQFRCVIASDFSESMLSETRQRVETTAPQKYSEDLLLVRADVSRLPFKSASLSAIYSGAAIHCWPSPQQAFAEISRVLKPGGVFVASTFLFYLAPIAMIFGDDLVANLKRFQFGLGTSPYNTFLEQDITDLIQSVGLKQVESYKRNRFLLFSAVKPEQK
eukprot:TRINITY_DN25704_c0_g1_i1.p2 TRINITY_DN25704_c0_g1~~TRINITY_DN25704_c0_g1_i1.p2  ORF type:complete len:348 (-),score=19.87 TRINITY_DN25704_c0_g1_i1:316-1359(-)